MDPLSLVASILTIVGVGGAATDVIRKLALVEDAPAIVLSLNNEVSDLTLTLLAMQDILQKSQSDVSISGDTIWLAKAHERVSSSLHQAQDKVAKLVLLHDRLKRYTLEPTAFQRISWLREQKKFKRMQEDLRSVRQRLVAALGMLSASHLINLQEKFRSTKSKIELGVQSTLSKIESEAQSTQTTIEFGVQSIQSKVEQVWDLQSHNHRFMTAQDSRLHEYEHAASERATRMMAGLQELKLRIDSLEAKQLLESTDVTVGAMSYAEHPRLHNIKSQNVRIAASYSRRSCKNNCECGCHRRHKSSIKSPKAISAIIGTLFAGYTGTPILDEACHSHPACSKREGSITLLYVFPSWFLARALAVALSKVSARGPELHIRIINVVSESSQVFLHAASGDVDSLKNCLRHGIGSPMDIDSTGASPLMIAIKNLQIDACRVLLFEGADPYYRNSVGLDAFDVALSSILCGGGNVRSREALRKLLPIDDALDQQNFSLVHKAVLGLTPIDLEQILQSLPKSLLNIGDTFGRTPLYWAAHRGDSKSVALLLEYGADALCINQIGVSPLHVAIVTKNQQAIRQLIKVSSHGDRDLFGYLPIHYACEHGVDLDIFKEILSRSHDINSLTRRGETPLTTASYRNKLNIAEWLIDQGANLDMTDIDGRSCLHLAIYGNSNPVLRLLLRHRANHRAKTNAGETLLHYAAQYGNLESIQILSVFRLDGIDVEDRVQGVSSIRLSNKVNGMNALEIAEQVREANSDWLMAFRDLVRKIRASGSDIAVRTSLNENEDEAFEDAVEHQE